MAVVLGVRFLLSAQHQHVSLRDRVKQLVSQSVLGSKPFNILLIGNNARNASSPLSPGQADLIVVAHVVPAKHEVVMITIPRNVMVAYPHYRDPIPKIKSAFLMGGPKLAVTKVAAVTGMPIHDYVIASFQSFADAVDAAGGVTMDIPKAIRDPEHSHAEFTAGVHHLNGAQALAFVRVRQNTAGNGYRVNDFQRESAAVSLMRALEHQVLQKMSPGELSRLMHVWQKDVATNLSTAQVAALALNFDHGKIVHVQVGHLGDSMDLMASALPGINAAGHFDGAYYDIVSDSEIESALAKYGAKDPNTGLPKLPAASSIHVAVTDDGGGAALRSRLQKAGLHVVLDDSVPQSSSIEVLYPQGDLLQAMVVGRAVADSSEVVKKAAVSEIEVRTR